MGRKRTEKLLRRAVAAEAQRMVADQTPAGRMQIVTELLRLGWVTQRQAQRIVVGPDRPAETRDPVEPMRGAAIGPRVEGQATPVRLNGITEALETPGPLTAATVDAAAEAGRWASGTYFDGTACRGAK